jgi:acetyltransferase-like isoleucine patch superfamily enzyme
MLGSRAMANLEAIRGDVADDVDLGPYCVVAEGAHIGAGCRLGAHVVVHPGTSIGEGCEVQDNVVLGKPPKLARHSTAGGAPVEPLAIEDGAVICCGAVVFAGARIAAGAIVGDQAYVRERSVIGPGSVIGRGSAVDNDVMVHARVRVQTDVYLTAYSLVEDDVFVGPGVLTTNDSTMARHDEEHPVVGVTLRRACRIGGAVVVTPGIEIGEEAFVAAGAVVTKDIPAHAVVMGVPGRIVRQVPEPDLLEHWR